MALSCAEQHGSVGLRAVPSGVPRGVVAAVRISVVAVGNAVVVVVFVVVGGTSGTCVRCGRCASCGRRDSSAKGHKIDRDDDDQRQHGAHHDHYVEGDADACVALLCGPSGPQRHDGQDEGGDGAHEEDERSAAAEQRDDGEDDSAHRHSRVVLLRRRPVNGRHRGRLGRHNDSGVGGGDGGRSGHRLVALLRLLPAIGVWGRLVLGRKRRRLLRRELGRSGLVSVFGVLLVGMWCWEGLLIGVRSSHCATVNNTRTLSSSSLAGPDLFRYCASTLAQYRKGSGPARLVFCGQRPDVLLITCVRVHTVFHGCFA